MKLKKYTDYFTIDRSYYPEINPESVKDERNRWDRTYPHKDFVLLMNAMSKMLARANNKDKHDLWIHGAFGTGKSRLMWTLYNLLNCTDEELTNYFASYETLRQESDLRDQLLARKHEKILTVFRYSTGEIESIKDFVTRIYDSVTSELKARGMNPVAGETIRGKVADAITSEDFRDVFARWFAKPEYRGLGGINGKTVDVIASQLRDTSASADTLLADILRVAEDMGGFRMFEITVDSLKDWLKEVIKINQIDHIVFFWDEFSSFFKKHRSVLDCLQNLQEMHDSTPFNFVIATHEADVMKAASGGSAVFDRFNNISIEMPDPIAFELIHDALVINPTPGIAEEYEELTKDLASSTAEARTAVCKFANIEQRIIRNILPIHPMAALLLKYISTEFASNQRSMFNFIKNDDSDELEAFQWFIKTKSPESGDILTIDYLWKFFYESGRDENSSNTGRSNLSQIIRTILDTYTLNEHRLSSDDEKRVLKTVLMMQAISRKLNNGVALLRPTEKNIRLAFLGDDALEGDYAINIIRNILVPNKILYLDTNGKETEFAAAAVSGDQSKIDEIKEKLRATVKTAQLAADGELKNALVFSDALKTRFSFGTIATVDDIQTTVNRVLNESSAYKFKTVICFARDESEQQKIKEKLAQFTADLQYKDIIFIDASANLLGLDSFEAWTELAATEQHFRKPDPHLADQKADDAKQILLQWKNRIRTNGQFVIYCGTDYKENCGSVKLLEQALQSFVIRKYPFSFDNAGVAGTIFTSTALPSTAKGGIQVMKASPVGDKDIDKLLGQLRNVDKYWEAFPSEPLSQLKVAVDKMIETALNNEQRIAMSEIIDMLISKGFTPHGVLYSYLTGFLLKEYAGEPYRYSDGHNGDNGGKMTPDKLSSMIGECYKHKKENSRYTEKYIEIMTKPQSAFVSFISKTFDISDVAAVESAARDLRTKYKNNIRFPIWCIRRSADQALSPFFEKLAAIMYSNSEETVPRLSGELGELLLNDEQAAESFASMISAENGAESMKAFLQVFENGEILRFADMIHVGNLLDDVLKQIASGAQSYLWDQNEGEEQLRSLLLDYQIIYYSNAILKTQSSSMVSCIRDWKRYSQLLRVPSNVLKRHCSDLADFISILKTLNDDNVLPSDKKELFLSILTSHKEDVLNLKNRLLSVYQSAYTVYTTGLSEEEISSVIAEMPNTSFLDSESQFESALKTRTDTKKKEQEQFKLKSLWKQLTGSASPESWSKEKRIPIRIMVSEAERDQAEMLFRAFTIDSNNAKSVHHAFEYLDSKPAFIEHLANRDEAEDRFRELLVGKYSSVIYDIDALREYLTEHCAYVTPFEWYGHPAVQKAISEYAVAQYRTAVNEGVMQRIDDMSPETAKSFLKKLAENDVDVGISIILNGGV